MNITQLQERVRLELLRRIRRGTLSVSLLARQAGLGQPHVSNFLLGRRQLSGKALDKVMAAQRLDVEDLMPSREAAAGVLLSGQVGEATRVPLVPYAVAAFEPFISASKVEVMLPLPAALLAGLRTRCAPARMQWERFVAVQASAEDVRAMRPELWPEAVMVLDRHYTSFRAYEEGRQNVYGARVGARMLIRYAEMFAERVVLKGLRVEAPLEVVEIEMGRTPGDVLVGRVVLVLNPR